MSLELVGQIGIAILGVVSAVAPLIGNAVNNRSPVEDLRGIAELNKFLPEESGVRAKLETYGETLAESMIEDFKAKRDPIGIVLALNFIALSVTGGIIVIALGGDWLWWLIPIVLVYIIGSVGLAADASKRQRKPRP